MKIEEYLSSYEKLLTKIQSLLDEDKYTEVMGLISEIDHLITLIDREVQAMSPEEKEKIRPRAQEIIKRQESILAQIDEKVKVIQDNISMIPKLQKAAKAYGQNKI